MRIMVTRLSERSDLYYIIGTDRPNVRSKDLLEKLVEPFGAGKYSAFFTQKAYNICLSGAPENLDLESYTRFAHNTLKEFYGSNVYTPAPLPDIKERVSDMRGLEQKDELLIVIECVGVEWKEEVYEKWDTALYALSKFYGVSAVSLMPNSTPEVRLRLPNALFLPDKPKLTLAALTYLEQVFFQDRP